MLHAFATACNCLHLSLMVCVAQLHLQQRPVFHLHVRAAKPKQLSRLVLEARACAWLADLGGQLKCAALEHLSVQLFQSVQLAGTVSTSRLMVG